MYAVYTHNTNITQAKLMHDIAELLTGQTVVANLSDAVTTAASSIDNAVSSSTWLVHDQDAAMATVVYTAGTPGTTTTTDMVFKSDVTDLANTMYLRVTIAATTIKTTVYETWGVGTGAGTNVAANSDTWTFSWAGVGASGLIHVSASGRHALFNSGPGGGATGTRYGPYGVMEFTRRSPWDNATNAIPNFAFFAPQSPSLPSVSLPSTLDAYFNTTVVGITSYIQSVFAGGSNNTIIHQRNTVDATRATAHALIPFGHSNATLSNEGGEFSSLCNVYLTSNDTGGSFDEVTVGAATYVIWAFYTGSQTGTPFNPNSQRWAIRKG